MQSSESTTKIYTALFKAQQEFEPVKKTTVNTFHKSKYATLDDVVYSVSPILYKHDLFVIQPVTSIDGCMYLETKLIHSSGEWISSQAPIPDFDQKGASAMQTVGIGITYMRRYMLSSLLGILTEDDSDGNKPRQQSSSEQSRVTEQEKASKEQVAKIKKLFVECYEQLKADDEKLDEKINALLAKRRFNKLDELGKNEAVAVTKKLEGVKNAE